MEDRRKIIISGSRVAKLDRAFVAIMLATPPIGGKEIKCLSLVAGLRYQDDEIGYAEPSEKGKRYGPTRKGKGGKIRRW